MRLPSIHREVQLRDGMKVTIRPLSGEDREALIEFFENIGFETRKFFHPFPFTKEKAMEIIESLGQSERFYVVGVDEDGRILGIVYLDPFTPGSVARLGIGVRADIIGRGLGSHLMKFIIDAARTNRVKRIELNVYADNCRAIALYCKFGFEVYHVKKRDVYLEWDGRRHTVYLMELELG